MPKYISQYEAIVHIVRSSDEYRTATSKEKQEIDEWLSRKDVRDYFGKKLYLN
jgi:predicted NAD/FAD-binding protein